MIDYPVPFPKCPSGVSWTVPSFLLLHVSIIVVCVLFACITLVYYTAVPASFRSLRMLENTWSRAVRNELWVLYFGLVAFRSLVRVIGMESKHWIPEASAMVLHGITAYVLVCALQWQRRYRSRGLPETRSDIPRTLPISHLLNDELQNGQSEDEAHDEQDAALLAPRTAPAHEHRASLLSFVTSTEFCGFALLAYYLAASIVRVAFPSVFTEYVHLSAVILQRLLILVVLLIIVFMPPFTSKTHSSPSIAVRLCALLSIMFNIPNDLPFIFWYKWTPWAHHHCYLYIFSFYDFITISYLISLFLWMFFIVSEFHRSREQAMYYAFQVTQSAQFSAEDNAVEEQLSSASEA